MEICHLMPKLASMGKKLAIVRSLTDIRDEHAPNQTESGWSQSELRSVGGHPSLGCVMSRLKGATTANSMPTFVDLGGHSITGFLGPVYSGFRPNSEGRSDLQLQQQIGLDRFRSRNELLGSLDRIRRDIDGTHAMDAMDAFNQRAVGLITSNKMAEALTWEKADPKVRERYGIGADNSLSTFLVAKRLIECGVRVVSLSWGGWDTHGDNFNDAPPPIAAARHGLERDDRRPRFVGSVEQHDHRHVGRIRPHAADQSASRPRSLGSRRERASWPAAECGWARSSARRIATAKRRKTGRSTCRKCSPRSITYSASTRTRRRSAIRTAARNTW